MASKDSTLVSSQKQTAEPPNHEPMDEQFRPCPLRRLETDAPGVVFQEFMARANDMPPDHTLLMKKFQDDQKLRSNLDERFSSNKEGLLLHLWDTHKHMFRPLDDDEEKKSNENIIKWIENVTNEQMEAEPT